jgi:hypothetical protein
MVNQEGPSYITLVKSNQQKRARERERERERERATGGNCNHGVEVA